MQLFQPIILGSALALHFTSVLSSSVDCSVGFVNIATSNPDNCAHPTSYFCQLVDHRRPADRNNTFLQQYQMVTDFFKPGGPILFLQGDEANLNCVELTALYEYANELGALLVSSEHRYFGISSPFGLNSSQSASWTVQEMRPLTLDNILADSAVLLRWIRKIVPGAQQSKVIAFGGSYGGFLVPQLKIKYPDVFHGIVATGGVFAGLNTSPGPRAPGTYATWVSNVYADLSFEAASVISAGFNQVRTLMANGSFDVLAKSLQLCTTPSASDRVSALTYAIYQSYEDNSQFAQATPVYGLPANSIRALINETLAAANPLAALNSSIAASLKFKGGLPCFAWDSSQTNTSASVAESTQYSYMICTFMAYPHGTSANDTIFGVVSKQPFVPDMENVNEQECRRLFNITAKTGDVAYQEELGISQRQLENEERMFFVEAQYDWVSVLGLQSWVASGNQNQSRWWYMADASHTEDIVHPTEYDSQALKDTRVAIMSYMKTWLGM